VRFINLRNKLEIQPKTLFWRSLTSYLKTRNSAFVVLTSAHCVFCSIFAKRTSKNHYHFTAFMSQEIEIDAGVVLVGSAYL
tara:strand:- start:830 stop:1072 length:243 start_codon:yes stop_codon:yes gene_type:complete